MLSKARLSLICLVSVILLGAPACAGSTNDSGNSASPSATSTTQPAEASASQSPTGEKVSANTASDSEIEAALSAAGVPNAARWAHEVVEYRPYPADDPDLKKLRDNLAKYNPGEETVDKIVSALTP